MTGMRHWVVLVVWLWVAWIVMGFAHELGHLIGGWLAGATLLEVRLAPWGLPSSLHHPDPNPLVTLWGGPVIGVGLPLCLAALIRRPWADFVASFCLLANGTYLVVAWFSHDSLLDTPRLLKAGAPPILIAIFCLLTIGVGYIRFRRDCIRLLDRSNRKTFLG